MAGFDYTITLEDFDSLSSFWLKPRSRLQWDCIFVLPPWLETWWQELGPSSNPYLGAVKWKGTIIGIAPLLLKGKEACFIGSADVCDCSDFVVRTGSQLDFFSTLLDDLIQKGIRRLYLGPLRPESTVLSHLVSIADERGYEVSCATENVSLELDLPSTWEGYLEILNQKQRHEVRRKLRRLREVGELNYKVVEASDAVPDSIDLFLRFFRESRQDKETFLTGKRESFFRALAKAMSRAQLLRMGILELDTQPVAAVMCFDYSNTVYLYNSSYNPQYGSLSVGLISKILCIKDSIERGRGKFDFLKGAEQYKYRLGGKEIPLQGCTVVLR
jgi:CelD/BcsL family acetyltransferase involved in cellulose biosynthesis